MSPWPSGSLWVLSSQTLEECKSQPIPTDTREELLTHLRTEKLQEAGGCSALSLPASVWPGGWGPCHSSEHPNGGFWREWLSWWYSPKTNQFIDSHLPFKTSPTHPSANVLGGGTWTSTPQLLSNVPPPEGRLWVLIHCQSWELVYGDKNSQLCPCRLHLSS